MNSLHRMSIVVLALSLSGCGDSPTTTTAVEGTNAPAEPAAAEAPMEPGLLLDPRFEVAGNPQPHRHWQLSQHAGATSYEYRVEDGVLIMQRIGAEPWGVIQQTVDGSALTGKTLEFSAELAGELDDSFGPPFEPTGLAISVLGFGPSDLPMMGKRILLAQNSEPALSTGRQDWQRHSLRFEIPQATQIEVILSLKLTHGGSLKMRNPSLRVIE